MKEIKNYLPFYLGCNGEIRHGEIVKLTTQVLHQALNPKSGMDFKPILRPLSDITEEEMTEQEKIIAPYEPDFEIDDEMRKSAFALVKEKGIMAITFDKSNNPLMIFELFRFYLSKGFDLFGLIESGLAIDKTTLNK